MTTYYVRKTGSDAAAGTSAGTAWLTIGKSLASGSGPTGGDIIYVGAGVYRENVTCNLTSPASELQIIADIDGSKTGDAGLVRWTCYTTNDTTVPSGTCCNLNGKNHLTFVGFQFEGGTDNNGSGFNGNTANSQFIKWLNCTFCGVGTSGGDAIWLVSSGGTALNFTVDRCIFMCNDNGQTIVVRMTPTAGSDWDNVSVIKNSLFVGSGYALYVDDNGGSGAGHGGGISFLNNTCVGVAMIQDVGSLESTTIPIKANYNVCFWPHNTALTAGVAGEITEDYNVIYAGTARSNVTAGAHSFADFSHAPHFEMGQSQLLGLLPNAFGMLPTDSPLLGLVPTSATPTPPTVDLFNRPRPAGGSSLNQAVGALEAHNTAAHETTSTNVDGGTGSSIKLAGPADHDILIPVDAVSNTITIKNATDSNYGNVNKPQVQLLAAPEIGVTAQTVTSTATASGSAGVAGTFVTISLTAFTPTAKGWVTLRLVGTPGAATGICWFDTLTVS